MAEAVYLAVDLGASSGRHVAGKFDGLRLSLEELHRFTNGPVAAAGHLYWDLLRQWTDVTDGLRAAAAKFPGQIRSVGVDTWGVDFILLGAHGELLGNPYHYRDPRTNGMLDYALSLVSREQIFAQSGLQFMQINTLYQLLAMKLAGSTVLDSARSMLMIPDAFHWLLTGEISNEFTNSTTTQFYDPRRQHWAIELLKEFRLPTEILGPISQPGAKLGPLLPSVAAATGLNNVEVVLPGTHDTASAVLAVPAASVGGSRPDWCYISSGTWSLMGVELSQPVINDRCLQLNFTNEGGVGGTIRLLKNIGGLWLVQECRRAWNQRGRNYSWEDLNRMSLAAPPLAALVDPDDASFLAPADMPEALRNYLRRTGQAPCPDDGSLIRCAIESLALRYRYVLGSLEELTGSRLDTIHIVGGGSRNVQLCQATADACHRRVLAGPVEATAIGNVLMQAIAAGEVSSIAEGREVIRRSFLIDEYLPRDTAAWDEAYGKFQRLTSAG